MKTLLRSLVFGALITSSLNSFAMSDMNSDSNMYVNGSLVGIYNNKSTATISSVSDWVQSANGSSAKVTYGISMDNDINWGGQVRFGYAMSGGYTIEGTASYLKLNASLSDDSADLTIFSNSAWNFHVNALMNFENSTQFTPNVGVGLGVGMQNIDFSDCSNIAIGNAKVTNGAASTNYNFKNSFAENASGDQMTSEWKMGALWQVFGGVAMDLVPDQVSLSARVSCGSSFTRVKYTSSSDDAAFVQYKPIQTAGIIGVNVHF